MPVGGWAGWGHASSGGVCRRGGRTATAGAANRHRRATHPEPRRCGRMPEVSFTALTPLAFLRRSADVFASKTAIVYGERRSTYREFGAEANRLARALQAFG